MKADKPSAGRVFDMNERLEAPLFQRPYVWKEDRKVFTWLPILRLVKNSLRQFNECNRDFSTTIPEQATSSGLCSPQPKSMASMA